MDVKENKKFKATWIFGRYDTDKRPVAYPPVIPWVKPEQHDALQKYIVSVLMGSGGQKLEELNRKRAELAKLDHGQFMTPVQKRQVLQLRRTVEKLEQETAGLDKGFALQADRFIGSWNMVKGIRSIEMDKRAGDPCIKFTTSPICIRKVVLGTYDFWVDMTKTNPKETFFLLRRDSPQKGWTQGPHPHWKIGRAHV